MITFTQGNLLEADTEALVNTVNTVGVMGKGIALMFKERFTDNHRRYIAACKAGQVCVGKMFVTDVNEMDAPRWIVNFPTKQHWRNPSKMEWITEGLQDLRLFLLEKRVKSIAIPPLGAGNGRLNWFKVRKQMEQVLAGLDTQIIIYEPTQKYQNVSKRTGIEELTPARALIAELVRRYWVLGMECSLLEIQKLAWFLERNIERAGLPSLDLRFKPYKYGPYADRLRHLLTGLDGNYLHCARRLADAKPLDVIWFNDERKSFVQSWLHSEAKDYIPVLETTTRLIDGFESPYGLELLASVDWLLSRHKVSPQISALREGLRRWPGGAGTAGRKDRLFDDRALGIALQQLTQAIHQ